MRGLTEHSLRYRGRSSESRLAPGGSSSRRWGHSHPGGKLAFWGDFSGIRPLQSWNITLQREGPGEKWVIFPTRLCYLRESRFCLRFGALPAVEKVGCKGKGPQKLKQASNLLYLLYNQRGIEFSDMPRSGVAHLNKGTLEISGRSFQRASVRPPAPRAVFGPVAILLSEMAGRGAIKEKDKAKSNSDSDLIKGAPRTSEATRPPSSRPLAGACTMFLSSLRILH